VRLHQLEEVVQICRAMWTEEHPTFHGKYFDIEDAAATPRPDVSPPVCIGSSGETIGLKIVGRRADMWNTAVPDEESWKRKHDIVCEAATAFGRDCGEVTCCLTVAGPLPESDNDSEQWLERLTGFTDLGVSYFVLDFGHPLSAEPALRFAEQVIAPMRRVTS
jgi:alkanesulfonate monooxygenase SsuD/methylene tetrahydromethanopterin reductase-like flavin-dependent oxidoreductase (luciferase family)